MILSDLHVSQDVEPYFDAQTDVWLWLFTRANPLIGQRIHLTTDSIAASNFNPNHPVRILIHGKQGIFLSFKENYKNYCNQDGLAV